MPRLEQLRLHSLRQFVGSVLDPALKLTVGSVKDNDLAVSDQATALGLEAVWWLLLGVDLEFFPEQQAIETIRSYRLFAVQNVESFFQRRDRHFHANLVSASRDLARASSHFFENGALHYFLAPEALRPVFQELLIKLAYVNADGPLRAFCAALNFATETDVVRLLERAEAVEALDFETPISAGGISPESLLVGYLKGLQLMQTLRESTMGVLQNPAVEDPDAYAFIRLVASFTRWRFSFHVPGLRDRFRTISGIVYGVVNKALAMNSLAQESRELFDTRIEGTINDWQTWGSPRELSV